MRSCLWIALGILALCLPSALAVEGREAVARGRLSDDLLSNAKQLGRQLASLSRGSDDSDKPAAARPNGPGHVDSEIDALRRELLSLTEQFQSFLGLEEDSSSTAGTGTGVGRGLLATGPTYGGPWPTGPSYANLAESYGHGPTYGGPIYGGLSARRRLLSAAGSDTLAGQTYGGPIYGGSRRSMLPTYGGPAYGNPNRRLMSSGDAEIAAEELVALQHVEAVVSRMEAVKMELIKRRLQSASDDDSTAELPSLTSGGLRGLLMSLPNYGGGVGGPTYGGARKLIDVGPTYGGDGGPMYGGVFGGRRLMSMMAERASLLGVTYGGPSYGGGRRLIQRALIGATYGGPIYGGAF